MSQGQGSRAETAELPTAFALIALCPILVFCLAEVILAALAHNAVPAVAPFPACTGFPEAGEAAARLQFLGLAFLVLLGAAGMVLKTAHDVVTYVSGPAKTTLRLAGLLALVVGVAFLGLMAWLEVMRPSARLGDALFARLFQCLELDGDAGLWSRGTYRSLTGATHVAVLLAIAAMITGAVSCLARFPGLDETETWRLQSQRLKTYATISAAFLVVSVFYFKSWADYPAFLLAADGTDAAKAAQSQFTALAKAYTTFTGIEYSLVLAAYTLPVAYFQSRAADRIAKRLVVADGHPGAAAAPETLAIQVKAVRLKEGLQTSGQDVFKIVLAIVSPLVTGALTNLAAAVA